MIVFGDFNVEADDPDVYKNATVDTACRCMHKTLSRSGRQLIDVGALSGHGTNDALATGGDRRIDYIFVSAPSAISRSYIQLLNVQTLPLLDQQVPKGSLSNHLAVACQANFRWMSTK